ncbi:MAG: hypothetical protein RL701_5656 [Pseudomonadota bacterium]|jgi:cytochrome c553
MFPSPRFAPFTISLFAITHGCGHCEAPAPARVDAKSGSQSAEHAHTDQSTKATETSEWREVHPQQLDHDDAEASDGDSDPEDHEPLSSIMLDHFYIAAWARDAVVYGDIDALREPLQSLASYKYPAEMPLGVSELQAAAALTARADTLTAAAIGVASMARVCGDCHRRMELGIQSKKQPVDTSTPSKVDAISGRMFRHGWAAQRLWEGLVAPSDQAWTAGAAALAHAPMRTPKTNKPVSPEFAQKLRDIRELGVKASAATSTEERTNIYAQTLAKCAQCHADNVVFAIAGEPRDGKAGNLTPASERTTQPDTAR